MNFKLNLILAVAALFALGACSDSDTTTASPSAESVSGTHSLGGTWRSCRTETGINKDYEEVRTVSGSTVSLAQGQIWTSNDATCTGTSSADAANPAISFTIGTASDFVSLGWSDNNIAPVTAPAAQDGSGSLPLAPTTSLFPVTFQGVSAGTMMVYIDDSDAAAGVRWFRETSNPGATCADATATDGGCLFTEDFFTLQ